MKEILLSHGGGGKAMSSLIKELIVKNFDNEILNKLDDSAVLSPSGDKEICFTTDSYVVNPLVFPGGDIGELSVYGTINDLSVMGARPLYISCSFIIEEGMDYETLKKITNSIAKAAKISAVRIVTGDTKVVERGGVDKLFINTAGIGIKETKKIISKNNIKIGDKIILNGPLGEHGLAVMSKREGFESNIESDCAPLWDLVKEVVQIKGLKFMRDPTRGGLASVLNEIVEGKDFGIRIYEDKIPKKDEVYALSEILGFDPIYIANEGKVVIVSSPQSAENILEELRKHPTGKNASLIGEVTSDIRGRVFLKTSIGGERIIDMLVGEQLPRIC